MTRSSLPDNKNETGTVAEVTEVRASAVIIQFRPRVAASRPATPVAQIVSSVATEDAVDPQVRLARALGSLQTALATQKAAMTAWRSTLQELKVTTKTLDENMQRYRTSLRSLGTGVNELHQRARALEAMVERDPVRND